MQRPDQKWSGLFLCLKFRNPIETSYVVSGEQHTRANRELAAWLTIPSIPVMLLDVRGAQREVATCCYTTIVEE